MRICAAGPRDSPRIAVDMSWDNSAQNPANPDPSKVVHWGDQTWEEMNVGWFRFRNADEDDRANAALSADDKRADAPAPRQTDTKTFANWRLLEAIAGIHMLIETRSVRRHRFVHSNFRGGDNRIHSLR